MNIKDDLVRYHHWLRHYGLNDSHSGSTSVREGDVLWITPTDCCADALTSGDLVECPLEGPEGKGACAETPLHLAVFLANAQVRALLHSHGPYTVAMTMDNEEFLPGGDPRQFGAARVPVITIPYDDYPRQAPKMLAEVLGQFPVAVVRGHGVFACADTLGLAYKWTCALEHSAKTAFIAGQAGKI